MDENKGGRGRWRKGQSGNPKGRPRKDAPAEPMRAVSVPAAAVSAVRADAEAFVVGVPASEVAELRGAGRYDAWYNAATGFGTSRDKRSATVHMTCPVTVEEAEDLYRGDDLAARIVETLPNEMLREGFELSIVDDDRGSGKPKKKGARETAQELAEKLARKRAGEKSLGVKAEAEDELADRKPGQALDRARARRDAPAVEVRLDDLVEKVTAKWEELNLTEVLWQAMVYERAYGGGAILIGANDGQSDWTQPLNVKKVSQVTYLLALDPRECVPIRWYTDPRQAKFGQPAIYQLNPLRSGLPVDKDAPSAQPRMIEVHESRLIVFGGIRVSRLTQYSVTYGWGDSVYTRVMPVLRDFNHALSSAGVLVTDFAQGVFEMKGLAEAMTAENVADFEARMQLMDAMRSSLRSVMVDAEHEKFHREQTPVSGLADLIDRFTTRLAAAADMPQTLLMGTSPSGLNATGASDIRFFYDRVASMQRRKLAPALRYLTKIIMSLFGGEPEKWVIKFNPLWQPTEKEIAEARHTQMETDVGYANIGVLTPKQIGLARFSGAVYSYETHINPDDDDLPDELPEEEGAEELRDPEAMLEAAPGGAPSGANMPANGTPVQAQALNGVQVTSMLEICTAFFEDRIPLVTAVEIMRASFPMIDETRIKAMLPEKFEPAKEEPPVIMAPGGKPGAPAPKGIPGAPATKAPAAKPIAPKPGGDE